MAVDLILFPATVALPSKSALADFFWEHIGDRDVQAAIAEEEQYLVFQREMLAKLHYTREGAAAKPPYTRKLGLTARAGMIRSTLLLYASIAEAVLLYHADARGYELPKSKKYWNLGAAMRAWEDPPGSGNPADEVKPVWKTIDGFRQLRNHVHLFNKASDHRGRFDWLLEREPRLFNAGDALIEHLRQIQST